MQESYKSIQAENFQLRDYIINLQSRLIESQGEDAVPPPPHSLINPTPPLQLISQSPPPNNNSAPPPSSGTTASGTAGEKRNRDAVENSSFLQSVAAAAQAGTGTPNNFIAIHKGNQSPNAKRVKGESKEAEVATTNGAA